MLFSLILLGFIFLVEGESVDLIVVAYSSNMWKKVQNKCNQNKHKIGFEVIDIC